MSVVMAVEREIVKAEGANAAIVHQQVKWVIEVGDAFFNPHKAGWFTGSSEKLADLTGLSPDQCRRAMAKLLASGRMEKRQFRSSQGDQTCSYRPVDPSVSASGDFAMSGDGDSAESRSGDFAGSTSTQEVQSITSPNPSEAEGQSSRAAASKKTRQPEPEQPGLFGPLECGASTREERKHRADPASKAMKAQFEIFWKKYPGGKKGSKDAALRGYRKRLRDGSTAAEVLAHLERYTAARALFAELESRKAPLMNASSFLNGKFHMFDDDWTESDLEYWGAAKAEGPRRRTVEEILEQDYGKKTDEPQESPEERAARFAEAEARLAAL